MKQNSEGNHYVNQLQLKSDPKSIKDDNDKVLLSFDELNYFVRAQVRAAIGQGHAQNYLNFDGNIKHRVTFKDSVKSNDSNFVTYIIILIIK